MDADRPGPLTTVAVAVITYRRPELLAGLLASLTAQDVPAGFTVRLVVVDNDPAGSARAVVERAAVERAGPERAVGKQARAERAAGAGWSVDYVVEPDPGIPAARQRSVELCRGDDAVVFVDDDETCPPGWLVALLGCWRESGADVVTGPVHGELPAQAPGWARDADVHSSRGRRRDGARLDRAYTNNTLVSRAVLDAVTPAFDSRFRFTGSSDLHFFQRVHAAGFEIRWCAAAEVTETVPLERTTLGWLVRRAFRSGAGDAISRRLIHPGPVSVVVVLGLAGARALNGVLLLALGLLPGRRAARVRGLRRVCSGIGTLAGLFGLNHQEYRRADRGTQEQATDVGRRTQERPTDTARGGPDQPSDAAPEPRRP